MADALEASGELAAVAGIYVLIGILFVVGWTFARLAGALDFSLLGFRPLHGVASAIENVIVDGCNDGIHKLEHYAIRLESGLIDSFGLFIGVPLVIALSIKDGLQYLWDHALKDSIHSVTNPIRAIAASAQSDANLALHKLEGLEAKLTNDAQALVDVAVTDIHRLVLAQIGQVEDDIRNGIQALSDTIHIDIHAAINGAEAIGQSAVDDLRRAEDAAIGAAERLGNEALTDLRTILGPSDLNTVAGIIASVPLLGLLVHTIAAESGLDSAECRSKVKGICRTDASSWGRLLSDLAPLAVGLSLAELAPIAREATHDLVGVIETVAG